jgi:XTP/dITP diphosphohydrolase
VVEIVIATKNVDKIKEIRELLSELSGIVSLIPATDLSLPDIEEDMDTLEGNARKKAMETMRMTGRISIAEDTGLEVEALGGAPGVLSSRFAGKGATYADNVAKLLKEMEGVEDRRATFRTVVAIALPDGDVRTVEGSVKGIITEEPRGEGGFGYDPVFLIPELGKTFAELSIEEKNLVSHRGKAFRKALEVLKEILDEKGYRDSAKRGEDKGRYMHGE